MEHKNNNFNKKRKMEYKGWGNLKREEKVNLERRRFLKKSALGLAGFVASMKGIDKAIDFFSQDIEKENKNSPENNDDNDENEISIKEPKKEKPDDISEAIEPQEISEGERIKNSKEKISNAEEMADEILRVYNSPAISERFDREVFTKDFFMAQQFQESRGDHTAESSAGARGVYQNKPESVVAVVRFLHLLKEKTEDFPRKDRCDYSGPADISTKEAEKISALFLEKADYGRATGKLYLLSIHDKLSRYNNDPNPDVFRSKSPERQQELLLLSYHDGPSRRRNPEKASHEGKNYVRAVKRYIEIIDNLRNLLEKAELSRDLDYAILKILQELDRRENRNKTKEVVSKWLKELQEAHMAKWREGENFGEPLRNDEIRKLFASK
ncbi:MAG: hypothetical protein PF549_05150 [Patescibacteria group bacterium]|jgi:hypothetical protein|nr:hypothetical protein [Patescibacteria group bacterium]